MSGTPIVRPYSDFAAAPLVASVRQPNFEQFDIEIDADVTITTLRADKSGPNDLNVPNMASYFAGALSGPEVTAFDVLVAAHLGQEPARGNDTHTFVIIGGPTVNDDESVIGVGGIPKYQVGDFVIDPNSGPNYDWWIAADLSVGAAKWDHKGSGVAASGATPSLELIATNDAIAVSTNPGPIAYNSSDLTRIAGFFTYSSPTLTCQIACRVLVLPRLDSTVNSGSSRSGIRLDIRKNDVSVVVTDNNSDSSGGNATDTQNNSSAQMELVATDTIKIYCNSYVTGLSDVWGGPNRMQLLVLEDLS